MPSRPPSHHGCSVGKDPPGHTLPHGIQHALQLLCNPLQASQEETEVLFSRLLHPG